jgi:hypothetical protein
VPVEQLRTAVHGEVMADPSTTQVRQLADREPVHLATLVARALGISAT